MTSRLKRHIADLERRLGGPPVPSPAEQEARDLARWFSFSELRLLTEIENPAEFDQRVAPLVPVAEARRAAGVNMGELDQAERAQERIVAVADPDGRPDATFYITCFPDPLRPGHWRADDDWYRKKWARRWPLPRVMTEAEVEARCPYQRSDRRCRCSALGERHDE